jgi:hypothetical protein
VKNEALHTLNGVKGAFSKEVGKIMIYSGALMLLMPHNFLLAQSLPSQP